MASSTSIFLALFLSALLLLSSPSLSRADDPDLDEDVAFLANEEAKEHGRGSYGEDHDQFNFQDFENYEDLEAGEGGGHEHGGVYEEEPQWPTVDDKDVVVLTKENFTEFVGNNSFVMVEFYAPWCGHCQALAPEYAAAATELKGVAALAKVDATEDGELAQKYEIQGFPTVFLFVDGEVQKTYDGERTK